MTANTQNNAPSQNSQPENKSNDRELNFRAQEKALKDHYERQILAERNARLESERKAQEVLARKQQEPEEDDPEPYVDHKKLNRTLSLFEQKLEEKIERKAEEKARMLYEQGKKDAWLKQNSDFYDVLQHAEKLAQKDPDLAESILEMPDTFERQKLVYKNIKAMGLHKPEVKEPSIQQKIDANRKGPFYQPSNVGSAPYNSQGDFSAGGQKNAYDHMQALKARLRLG